MNVQWQFSQTVLTLDGVLSPLVALGQNAKKPA